MLPAARREVPRVRSKRWNLLEGIAFCGECGARIGVTGGGSTHDERGQPVRYYLCASKRQPAGDGARCGNLMRRVDRLDAEVWGELRRVIEQGDVADAARGARADMAGGPDWSTELASYERQLAALERASAAILERYRRGHIPDAVMDRELAAAARQRDLLERNRDLARQEIGRARRGRAETGAVRSSLETLRAGLDGATAEDRQRVARVLVPGRDGLQVTLWRDRTEITGRLAAEAPSGATLSPFAAGSGSERSRGVLFRVVRR
jgi:hypothetical protein